MIKTGIDHTKIVFIDIETVHGHSDIYDIPSASLAAAWNSVCESRYKDELSEKVSADMLYKKYAALYPEFGRIICVSMGVFISTTEFRVEAFYGSLGDEKSLLEQVTAELIRLPPNYKTIGGHNILGFDIDYMIRRAIINGVNLPPAFDLYGIKPWDLKDRFVDTMVMWKGLATYLGSATLESIAAALGFKSPKEDMSGALVSTYYYMPENGNSGLKNLQKIGKYCNSDVATCAGIYFHITKGHHNGLKVVENKYE